LLHHLAVQLLLQFLETTLLVYSLIFHVSAVVCSLHVTYQLSAFCVCSISNLSSIWKRCLHERKI